jgi:hypothetical protein
MNETISVRMTLLFSSCSLPFPPARARPWTEAAVECVRRIRQSLTMWNTGQSAKRKKRRSVFRATLVDAQRLRVGQVKVTLPVGTIVMPEGPASWAAFVLLGEPD